MVLLYSPAARGDLAEIRDYIAGTLKNPVAAKNITHRILTHCSILKEQPLCGGELAAKTGRDTDLRYLVCGTHIAFYRIRQQQVYIIRILNGRTNYLKTLFEGEMD